MEHHIDSALAKFRGFGCLAVVALLLLAAALMHAALLHDITQHPLLQWMALSDNATATETGRGIRGGNAAGRESAESSSAGATTGRTDQGRSWGRYEVVSRSANPNRIVAGRKESAAFDVKILPHRKTLPSNRQLADIARRLHSEAFNATNVYFYLPEMDTRSSPWVTVFCDPGARLKLDMNSAAVPAKYRTYRRVAQSRRH